MAAAAVAGAADRTGRWGWWGGLGEFDLQVIDARDAQQGFARFGGDAVALAGGEAGQGEAKHGAGALNPHGVDPAQLQQAAAAAGVAQRGERLAGGVIRGGGRGDHWVGHDLVKTRILGSVARGGRAVTEALEGLCWPPPGWKGGRSHPMDRLRSPPCPSPPPIPAAGPASC